MNAIKAVLWDMDGTLVDSEHIAVEALALALREQGIAIPPNLHERVVGRAADDLFHWLVRDFDLKLDPIAWERRKHHYYMLQAHRLTGFDEAIACWNSLEQAGILQAVVSNSDRVIVDVNLGSVGLTRPSLVTVARNDIRKGKPDPEGYHRAAYLLGIPESHCLIVEDSHSGAEAGLASGMPVVFVPHATVPTPDNVRQLQKMDELADLVIGTFA